MNSDQLIYTWIEQGVPDEFVVGPPHTLNMDAVLKDPFALCNVWL